MLDKYISFLKTGSDHSVSDVYKVLGIDLEKKILHKIIKNVHREYKIINGVNTRVKEYEE